MEVLTPRLLGRVNFFTGGTDFFSAGEEEAEVVDADFLSAGAVGRAVGEGEDADGTGGVVVEGVGAGAEGLEGEEVSSEVGVGIFSFDAGDLAGLATPRGSADARGDEEVEDGMDVAGEEAEGVGTLEEATEGVVEGLVEAGADIARDEERGE